MQLLAERDRVRELEAELKSLMNKKYENESSIIERLRTSQDKLREQLRSVPFPHNDHSRIDIRTVQMGDGKTWPDPFAAVDLQYTGWRYDTIEEKWSKFTSTQISSTIFETRLGNHENIIGLEQAVLTMTLGETARVWVPSRLGYGVHGAEPLIPANTDLVFELSLVAVRNEMNDFEAANDDTPLDQRQLDHINSDEYGGSQLTSNNVKALEQMTGDGVYSMEDDVYDTAPRGRGNFQDL